MTLTHYRAPLDWNDTRLPEAERVWRRLYARAEKSDEPPPKEVVDALNDDLNTPRAYALMARYAAQKEGRKLWAAMELLGILPAEGEKHPVITEADRADPPASGADKLVEAIKNSIGKAAEKVAGKDEKKDEPGK